MSLPWLGVFKYLILTTNERAGWWCYGQTYRQTQPFIVKDVNVTKICDLFYRPCPVSLVTQGPQADSTLTWSQACQGQCCKSRVCPQDQMLWTNALRWLNFHKSSLLNKETGVSLGLTKCIFDAWVFVIKLLEAIGDQDFLGLKVPSNVLPHLPGLMWFVFPRRFPTWSL